MKYKDLTIDWLRSNVQHIHYFGLGFIQAKLTPETRLHFYTNDLDKTCDKEEVHNHRYNFMSTILVGSFNQQVFEFSTNLDGQFIMENESCTPGVEAPGQSTPVDLLHIGNMMYGINDSYYMHADTFHTVEASHGTITYLRRGAVSKDFATVIRPKYSEPVCQFSKNVPVDQLYEIVRTMLYK